MSCAQCQGIERMFDRRAAERELRQYRAAGPGGTTRLLIDALKAEGVAGLTLLDIGGGVGAIQHELLRAGARSATAVDASSAYLDAARAEGARLGAGGRARAEPCFPPRPQPVPHLRPCHRRGGRHRAAPRPAPAVLPADALLADRDLRALRSPRRGRCYCSRRRESAGSGATVTIRTWYALRVGVVKVEREQTDPGPDRDGGSKPGSYRLPRRAGPGRL